MTEPKAGIVRRTDVEADVAYLLGDGPDQPWEGTLKPRHAHSLDLELGAAYELELAGGARRQIKITRYNAGAGSWKFVLVPDGAPGNGLQR